MSLDRDAEPAGSGPEARLAALGLTLPKVSRPLAAYVPAVLTRGYVYTAGQLPVGEGQLLATGKGGAEIGTGGARALARACPRNARPALASGTRAARPRPRRAQRPRC